jgi:sodium-dependent dicarboxylate transporter 2/3/5
MWMTDMAVAAMLLPIAKAILEEEGLKPLESNFGRSLMIACVWGPLIGGVGTPAGAGPNPLAIGFIKDMTGITVSFLDWMKFGVPSALLMIIPGWFILTKMFEPEITHLSKTKADMVAEYKALPPWSKDEIATGIIFLITVFLWLSSPLWEKILGIAIPTSMPALVGCVLFFFPGVTSIKWKFVEEDISWNGILLILTGIALGMAVSNTGAAKWLSFVLLGGLAELSPLLQIFLIMMVISFLKVGFSSNTVTATIIVPLLIAMCQTYDLPILPILMPASITLSLAFILVTSSPTNVIPYSAGYFSIADFAKSGVVMTVSYSVLLTFVIYGIGMLSGMY